MHKHRREHRQIDRRWAAVKAQAGSTYWNGAEDVMPRRDLFRNHAVPVCEFGMTQLIQKDQYVDRDQYVVHNWGCLPLRIVITDRKKHRTSDGEWGMGSEE